VIPLFGRTNQAVDIMALQVFLQFYSGFLRHGVTLNSVNGFVAVLQFNHFGRNT